MSSRVKGFIAGVLAAVFYGTNPLGALPLYADHITSGNVLFYRYGITMLLFAAWMLLKKENFKIRRGHAIKFAILGVLFGLSSATLFMSFHFMNAGVASTILFSYPIITAMLMVVFYHERVTWVTTFALVLAITGIGLLYRGDGGEPLNITGVILVLASSFFLRPLHRVCSPVQNRDVGREIHLLDHYVWMADHHRIYDFRGRPTTNTQYA